MGVLTNRVAIVSGAGTGLGRAASISFAAEGADVVLLGRRASKLEETAQLVKERTGKDALLLQTDVSVDHQVQHSIELAYEQFGRVDILLNNAAVLEP
ncbi:SDR family NAD(P)-dependent oxidoreductase, partial [Paenibacillus sp. MCAF20]